MLAALVFCGASASAQSSPGNGASVALLDDAEQIQLQVVTAEERKQLLERARAEPPAGLGGPALRDNFVQRHAMAVRAQAPALARDIAKAWHEAFPADWQGAWQFAVGQLGVGHIQSFMELGQQAIARAGTPGARARLTAELVRRYLEVVGDFARAQQLLAQGERFVVESRNARFDVARFQAARGASQIAGVKAVLQSELGRFAPALESAAQAVLAASQALELAQMMGPAQATVARQDQLQALLSQARVMRGSGQLHDAEKSLRSALAVVASSDTAIRYKYATFQELAALRSQQGRFVESEQWVSRALALAPVDHLTGTAQLSTPSVMSLVQRQNALAGQQRFADVLSAMAELDARAESSPDLINLARNPLIRSWALLRQGQAQQALPWARDHQARLSAVLGRGHLSAATARAVHAWALFDAGQQEVALAAFDEALPFLVNQAGAAGDLNDQGLQRLLRRDIAAAYLRAVSLAPDAQRTDLGLRVADWVQSSSVLQALADAAARSAVSQPGLQDLLRREQDIRNEIEALYRYLNRQDNESEDRRTPQIAQQMRERVLVLQGEHRQARDVLAKSFPDFDRLMRPQSPGTKEIASRLKPDEAFLQFLPTASATYVWVVTQGGAARLHRAEIGDVALAEVVKRLRATLDVAGQGSAAPAFARADAASLYQLLLRPLEAELAGKTHLIVVAAGALAQIPLAVLDTGTGAGASSWLIQRSAISQSPGAGAWLALQGARAPAGNASTFMGWGDPLFSAAVPATLGSTRKTEIPRAQTAADLEKEEPRGALRYDLIPPLPETRDEVVAIARTLSADPLKDTFFGAAATRASVLEASRDGRLATRRVILFATHGLVAGDLPNLNQPALAMAADGREKENVLAPLLTLEDVLGLKLNADWVVLSACNTAAADGSSEEALSGLARGFFYAGSRSLLVTHWAVESDSAMRLSTGTFEHYVANPAAPKAESLRQAMLKVMAMPQYAHPAFWAPYALVGDGGR